MKPITLANLAEKTEQEVFDYISNHLLTQMQISRLDENLSYQMGFQDQLCAYRGVNGLKCAAGCIISDEEYKEEFEAKSWEHLEKEGKVTSIHSYLITRLQRIHNTVSEEYWESELKDLAKEIDLIFNYKTNNI